MSTASFNMKKGVLHAEEVPVPELATAYGTPLYIYSQSHLQSQYRALATALEDLKPSIFYAVKANSNAAVIQTLAQEGAGADVVSRGELFRARRAGIPANKIAFAGVGKTRSEIEVALSEDILVFTVESEAELERISACAQQMKVTARIALRVNPDVDPKTHKYTSTGKKENKFGVDIERALKAYERAADLPGLELFGLHMHLGSPLMSTTPYVEALTKIQPLCTTLRARYPSFRHLDIGGGLGIAYSEDQKPPTAEEFAAAIRPFIQDMGLELGIEPGRFIAGNAGILVTRVEYIKANAFKHFVVVDAAMNDLLRPSLYEAHHDICAVRATEETLFGDVVGPICESGDFFALDRQLPKVQESDLLAVMSAGAYGFSMASRYNSRGTPAEVMVHGDQHQLVRERETEDDLVHGERFFTKEDAHV